MSLYSLKKENCTRCGTCVRLCVAKIIEMDGEKYPFVAGKREPLCIRCGQCTAFCPTACNALSFQVEEPVPVDASLFPKPESAETFLRSRRSIRYFKKEGLSRELLNRLFETARYAPTASNSQAVRWVVLETREKTENLERRIIEIARQQIETSPRGKTADMFRYLVQMWDAGTPIVSRGAPQLAIALVPANEGMQEDGAIALTYLELAAHALGAGCCWGGFFTHMLRAFSELRESLGIRDDEHVAGAQMIGQPVLGLPKRLPPRKTPDITWF